MNQSKFPPGWDDRRIQSVIAHYETQNEEDAVTEDTAITRDQTQTIMEIPTGLVSVVRELIAQYQSVGKAGA
ncbi:conserved hypothetical protein [Gammaproteobacteria bacterium]